MKNDSSSLTSHPFFLLAKKFCVLLMLIFFTLTAYAGNVKAHFDGAPAGANDLHVKLNSACNTVTATDNLGNPPTGNPTPPANPGPFGLPPAGIGTNTLDFGGGTVGASGAPNNVNGGTGYYNFDCQGNTPDIQDWWWTKNGAKLAKDANDCVSIIYADGSTASKCGTTTFIPTLTEWGVIVLALLILSMGMVFILKRQRALAMASASADGETGSQMTLFNKALFARVFSITLITGAAVLLACYFIFNGITTADPIGTVATSAIVAYMIHLLILNKKK